MRSRLWVVCAVGGSLVACGARVSDRAAGGNGGGGGASDASASGGRGSGGTSTAESGGGTQLDIGGVSGRGGDPPDFVQPPDGTACAFGHFICNAFDSYIDIPDEGGFVRLAYPSDAGCGACRGAHCDLYSYAIESCGMMAISVSACAGPDGKPPCLDTASVYTMHFIDRSGKRWTFASLVAGTSSDAVDLPNVLIDVQAILTFGDVGGAQQELPVHVHLCGDIRISLPPCF